MGLFYPLICIDFSGASSMYPSKKIRLTLHWRHNDHNGVSNRQPDGCLLNCLFRRRSEKTSKFRVTGLCAVNSPGPVISPHKGPATRKMFPFDDVIMFRGLMKTNENPIKQWKLWRKIFDIFQETPLDYHKLYRYWVHGKDSWWRHQMETFSALLTIYAGNSPVSGEFPTQRPVTRNFDVFFDLRLNKRLSKQSWGWWFEMPSWSLWRHGNVGTGRIRASS